MSHTIGIDLQPSKISAAVCRWSDGRWSDPEVVRLGKEDTAAPATVFVAADGNIVCGEIAEERGRVEPERLVDELVRQFGEPAGVLVDGRNWRHAELLVRLVRWAIDRVLEQEEEPATRVVIAYPTSWGPRWRRLLEASLADLGPLVVLLSQPQAARWAYEWTGQTESTAPIAVYNLSQNTLEVAVVDNAGELLGRPEWLDDLPGPVIEPGALVDQSLRALNAIVTRAGTTTAELSAVLLVGERSRQILIRSRLSESLRCPIVIDAEPEHTAVRGAAICARIDREDLESAKRIIVAVPTPPPVLVDHAPPNPILEPHAAYSAGAAVTESAESSERVDDAQFTVYRPARVRPQRWYPLLAFVHRADPFVDPDSGDLVDPGELVRVEADRLLKDQSERYHPVTADSELVLPRGRQVILQPWLSAGEFNPPQADFRWEEPAHRVEFRFRAASRAAGQRITGGLRVYLGLLLAGEVRFTIEVGVTNPPPGGAGLERIPVRRFRHIFASYSHLDSAVVTAVTDYAAVMGDRYLLDTVALRAGERWEPRLTELIEQSDIFQLFWSRNAMNSVHVRREWQHALRLRRDGFIRPVYWEEPRPMDVSRQLPPPEIDRLHWARLPIRSNAPEAGAVQINAVTGASSRVAQTSSTDQVDVADPPTIPGLARSQWRAQALPAHPPRLHAPPRPGEWAPGWAPPAQRVGSEPHTSLPERPTRRPRIGQTFGVFGAVLVVSSAVYASVSPPQSISGAAQAAPPAASPPFSGAVPSGPVIATASAGRVIPVGGAPGFVAVSSIIGTVTVADRSAPQVVVVDTISAKPIARVPLRTGNPQFLVMSPDGRLLYASTWNDAQRTGAVEVLDTNTHVTVATIPVPFRPQKAAIRPDGRQLYLPGGGAVLVIDTTKNTVVRRIAVPIEPRWVEFAPDGRTAYVAGAAMAVVSVINTATGAVRSGPTMPAGPAVALAVSPDARFIAAVNQGNNAVTLMNTAADTVVATVPVGASPSSVAWTPDRRSALVANADGTVTQIDPGFDPPYSTRRTYVPGGDKFSSIAVQSGTATVYLTDPTRGQLITFVTR